MNKVFVFITLLLILLFCLRFIYIFKKIESYRNYTEYSQNFSLNNLKLKGQKCIILFGLCRNQKSLNNLDQILNKYNYDTFAYINYTNNQNIKLREGNCKRLVDPTKFLKKNCLKYFMENQNNSELKIQPIYLETLKYGIHPHWQSKKELNKFLLYQLYSLSKCYDLFPLQNYQLIYCLRIDQFYSDLPNVKYEINTIYLNSINNKDELFDRNYIISSDIAYFILKRIDKVLDYCNQLKQPIHSEKFLKWIVEKNNINVKNINFEGIRVRCND